MKTKTNGNHVLFCFYQKQVFLDENYYSNSTTNKTNCLYMTSDIFKEFLTVVNLKVSILEMVKTNNSDLNIIASLQNNSVMINCDKQVNK